MSTLSYLSDVDTRTENNIYLQGVKASNVLGMHYLSCVLDKSVC